MAGSFASGAQCPLAVQNSPPAQLPHDAPLVGSAPHSRSTQLSPHWAALGHVGPQTAVGVPQSGGATVGSVHGSLGRQTRAQGVPVHVGSSARHASPATQSVSSPQGSPVPQSCAQVPPQPSLKSAPPQLLLAQS